jgi:hypothetical protein
MCILAHGEPPFEGAQAAHSCGKGHEGCVNPQHLSWKTAKANTADKYDHGTILRGEANPLAKLTDEQVIAIRADMRSLQTVADDYGVTISAVEAIQKGNTWTHVPVELRDRSHRGTRQWLAKLDDDKARAILKDPRLHREIAADYGITEGTVSALKLRRTWKHVTLD